MMPVRESPRVKREKHRQATSGFLWGTWIMLFLTVVLGRDTLQGFRSGEWVDISSDDSGLLVPWWVAAAITWCLFLFTLWCLREYLKLKRTKATDD